MVLSKTKKLSVNNVMIKLMRFILFFMFSSVSVSAENINSVGLKNLNVNNQIDNNLMEAVVFFLVLNIHLLLLSVLIR